MPIVRPITIWPMAHNELGIVLLKAGQVTPALDLFIRVQQLFEILGEQGACMASAALTKQADCLTALGRLDEAAGKYEEAIERCEKLEDFNGVAVGKGQLATVMIYQGRHADAISAYKTSRDFFAQQHEPAMVATAWHQIGRVHQEVGNYDLAETAYRQALEIVTRINDQARKAISLNQLGNLYCDLNRLEEAVTFYRQAVDIDVELGNLAKEGVRRNNIASTLLVLERYDEARSEIKQTIKCYQPSGTAVELWKAFDILQQIELATGNPGSCPRCLAAGPQGLPRLSPAGGLCAVLWRRTSGVHLGLACSRSWR